MDYPTPSTPEIPSNESPRRGGCSQTLLFVGAILILIIAAILARLFLPNFMAPSTALEPTPTPLTVTIQSIQPLAELATIELPMVVAVENQRVPDDLRQALGGREQITMLIYGSVKAGFDLKKLQERDLWTDNDRVQLSLPQPEILSIEVDFDKSHIVDYQRSFFVGNDPDLQADTLNQAVSALEKAAHDANILEYARDYAQVFFENHFRQLGFQEVRIVVQ